MSKKTIHFEISERKILLRVFDVVFVLLFLFFISKYSQFDYFTISEDNFYWTIVLALYVTVVGTVFEMYNLQVSSNRFQVIRSVILTTSVTTLLYILTPFYTPTLPSNRMQIVLFYFAILFALFFWRNIYVIFLASNRFEKQVVFVGGSQKVLVLINQLKLGNPHYHVKGFVSIDDVKNETELEEIDLDNLANFIKTYNISEIVVTNEINKFHSMELYEKLLLLLESGVVIRQYDRLYESETHRLPIYFEDVKVYKFFPFSRNNHNKLYLAYTRIFDIVFAIIGLVFFLGVFPIIILLNLVGNKGPLFYKQKRVGKNGKVFNIIKLRTMIINAEKDGAVFAKTNDSRITPIGKLLRKSRLDEIPQFVNILKGDMAIIGPRPERPIFVEQIAKNIPLYKTRHIIKPGLTGWAQVNYPYGQSLDDSLMKLRYDLYYIKHRSLFLDINIFIKTMSTVLFFKGQ